MKSQSVLISTLVLVFSVFVQNGSIVSQALAADTPAAAAAPAGGADSVEIRIKELHDRLKINQAQEDQWSKVTQQMRDHATAAHEMATKREGAAKTMTALEDLQSYSDIAKAHSDGMLAFIAVFTPLYNLMSDAQKKNADEVFRTHKAATSKKHKAALNKKAAE